MFFRLALGNVRKSLRDYSIYFVTLALGVAVFYAFNTISGQADFLSADKRDVVQLIGSLIRGVTTFLAVVLGFLMVYANNYLVRRRKRELGLYQLMGMTRGQVSGVLTLETLMAGVVAFAVGIAVGVLVSQLLVFVTANLLQDKVTNFAFRFSPQAFAETLACFALIFLVMLAFNLRTLRRVRLVDLMGAERANESVRVRSLPLSLALFAAGIALVVAAYARLLHDGLPVAGGEQMAPFLVTTAMVCVGTLLVFFGLAGLLLRVAQSFRGAYYHGLNMFTVRQIAAKVNTAAASMTMVSLILFLAITSVTGGLSICSVINQNMEQAASFDASVSVSYDGSYRLASGESPSDVRAHLAENGAALATAPVDIVGQLRDKGVDLASVARATAQTTTYLPAGIPGSEPLTLAAISSATGVVLPEGFEESTAVTSGLYVMSISDYNAERAFLGMDAVSLPEDGYLVTCDMEDTLGGLYDAALRDGMTTVVAGRTLRPAQSATVSGASARLSNSSVPMTNPGTLVVPDDLLAGAAPYESYLLVAYRGDTSAADAVVDSAASGDVSFQDVDGADVAGASVVLTRASALSASLGTTGIVSYLAIYIGFVLVISCAAILAIQQLSEASDSAPRYRVLSELGCPRSMSNRSLLVQTLVYFAFPLVVGLAHSICALTAVIRVVKIFGALNITGAAMTTACSFLVVYGGYFLITYLMARRVVNARTVEARS